MAGRSGTNKSAALGRIADIVDDITPKSIFDSGTIEGLAKSLGDNKGSVISINDEFANFVENLDAGSKRSQEKSRILTLYNGSNWSKKTKTSGCYNIEDPRFSIIGFTQPDYLIEFSRQPANVRDGFFQRFFVAVPDEVYVTRRESKEALRHKTNNINMTTLLKTIYTRCKKSLTIKLTEEADEVYTAFHDSITEFRRDNKYDNCLVSVRSKSKGLSLRISGIISLLRNALKSEQIPANQEQLVDEDTYMPDDLILRSDYEMALKMVEYSVATSFKLVENVCSSRKPTKSKVEPRKCEIPEPENFSMEYAKKNHNFVSYIVREPIIKIGTITGAKKYPIVKNSDGMVSSGKPMAMKFLKGLSALGLGNVTPNEKHFKRSSTKDCVKEEEKEILRKKLKLFDAELTDEEDDKQEQK